MLLPVGLLLHQASIVPNRLRQCVDLLLFGVDIRKAQCHQLVKECRNQKGLAKGRVMLLVALEFLAGLELFVVVALVGREEGVIVQEVLVDGLDSLANDWIQIRHGIDIHQVRIVVQVYQFLLTNLKLGHEICHEESGNEQDS